MTQSFECPHCGAPLDYAGEGETMRCPFCGNSLIVPPELRPAPPPPVMPPVPPPVTPPPRYVPPVVYAPPPVIVSRPARRRGGNCLGLLIVIIVAMTFFPSVFSIPALLRTFGRAGALRNTVPTFVAALVTQGLPENVAATAQAAMTQVAVAAAPTPNAQATRQALQTALTLPRSWPVTLSDGFDQSANGWPTGAANNTYYTGTRQIASGKYHWSINAKAGMSTYSFADMPTVTDFLAGVDVLMATMPTDGQAGLAFRHSAPAHTWYVFALKGNNTYALSEFDGQQWSELIPWTSSPAIHTGRTNRLEVSAQGAQIVLLINQQVVDYIEDNRLTEGDVGLGMDLAHAKDQAEVDFDNFEVRAPAP
jgi:hypothetical protein